MNLTATEKLQYFTTPGYPYGYAQLESIQWIITAPVKQRIEFTVVVADSELCCDKVEVTTFFVCKTLFSTFD